MDKPKVADYVKEGEAGFKINFTKLQKSINECSVKRGENECKKIFEDLGIEVY